MSNLQRYPLKLGMLKNEWDNNIYLLEMWLSSIVIFIKKKSGFPLIETMDLTVRIHHSSI